MTKRAIGSAIATLFLTAPVLWGVTQARIAGKITSSAGDPIPEATLTITSPELPTYTKEVTTDKKGRYKVLILDATKRYRFLFEADGFVPHEESVKVGAGSSDNEIDVVLKKPEEVLEEQQGQLQSQPGYEELHEGFELLKQGQEAEAREKLQAAVAVLPDLVNGWEALAEVDFSLGDYQAAFDNALTCLELDDESSGCLAVAANSANKLGRLDEHEVYRRRFEALHPDDPATIFNDAVPHLNAMDDEQARPILERCLEVDADFSECLYEYGMLLLRSGDMEGAKAHLERYLEVAPDGPNAATAAETIKYL
jgi:tetratricopeptide (TPR) repeat protein